MKTQIECSWIDNMAFEASIGSHKIIFDTDTTMGGQNRGPRPKPLLLAALAGCSGMDIVSILAKMKILIESFRMTVDGELTTEHPKYYKTINITYFFKGQNLDYEKLFRAVELSQEKYCGVSAQLKMGVPLTFNIVIE